ncbi:unnamed protein product [Cuscuta europaea]|uniref:Uncharacterized protein n=1 Tax=Cuscuta europaea TaxID=41803 RepID=A0A9P0ZW99_CUSEU|nr:unnamed protein product [Cuscuta europaea]
MFYSGSSAAPIPQTNIITSIPPACATPATWCDSGDVVRLRRRGANPFYGDGGSPRGDVVAMEDKADPYDDSSESGGVLGDTGNGTAAGDGCSSRRWRPAVEVAAGG